MILIIRRMIMKRNDGRKAEDLRPLEIKAGIIERADGSAMVKMGRTHALAAVYGPKELYPKFLQRPDKAVLQCKYSMAPFSTEDRVKPGFSRRSIEISKVMREALEPVIFLEEYPKTAIQVHVEILQADAGTRTAAINAAAVALADAGIPMRDLISSVSAGKIGNEYVLDLAGKEEEETDCDLPVAYSSRAKQITLLQMDGDLPTKDVKEVIKLAIKGCEQIYKEQKRALTERWMGSLPKKNLLEKADAGDKE